MNGKHIFDYQGTLKDFRQCVPHYMSDLKDNTPMYMCRYWGGIIPAEEEELFINVSPSMCQCPNTGMPFSATELVDRKANCLGRSRHERSIETGLRDSINAFSRRSGTGSRTGSSNWKDALGKRKWRVLTPNMPPKDVTGGD